MSGLTSPRLSTQGSQEMFCNDFSKPEVLYSADSLPDLLTEGHVSLNWSHRVIEQSVQSTVLLENCGEMLLWRAGISHMSLT